MEDVIVPIAAFAMLSSFVVAPIWLHHNTKQAGFKLIEKALEKGQELDPALVERLGKSSHTPAERARRSLATAIILTSIALGLAAIHLMVGETVISAHGNVRFEGPLPAAAFVQCIAFGFVGLWAMDRTARGKNDAKSPDFN